MDIRPTFPAEGWVTLLGADPRPWLWDSNEPAVQGLVLRELLDVPNDDASAREVHKRLLVDPQFRALIASLPDWEAVPVRGHNRPDFAPNLLNLLTDMGLQPGDNAVVEGLLDKMLAHQEPSGRLAPFGIGFRETKPVWGSVLCDSHAIIEVLVRLGRGDSSVVQAAIACMSHELSLTNQGYGWTCVPHSVTGWRGPGRKGDLCPQVTLEALRVYAQLPRSLWPEHLLEAASASLMVWRERGTEKPFMFGHGRQFKTVKWPPTWYDVSALLLTVSRYPELRQTPEDRRLLAELAACLVAYNFNSDGKVIPRSCYQGYEGYSFGQKKQSSPWATAYLCALLRRYNDLAEEIHSVDVRSLSSSKGGSGTAVPPRL
ncbi:MAG: hypothetical protein ACYCZF_00300 [Anaerolineae bacterium]